MNAMTRRHPVVLFVYYVMTLVLLIVAGHPLLYGLLLLLMGIDVSLNRGFLKMFKSFVGSLAVAALCVGCESTAQSPWYDGTFLFE